MIKGRDPNLDSIELMAKELSPLLDQLVLVGGCAASLLITDVSRPPVRETVDVDLVTEVAPLSQYYELCEKLRRLGFLESDQIICRWVKGPLIVDVMPTEPILGFTNRWYTLASKTAVTRQLPSGTHVRHVTAPLFIATKIESFHNRGAGNFLHHDIEDVINIVDGRPELFDEVQVAPSDVAAFLKDEIDDLLAQRPFVEVIPWHLRPDTAEQERANLIIDRLRKLAGL